MEYHVRAFHAGTFWVPKPEVYWMHGWGEREEMNLLLFLIQGGGQNILINTGPPHDLSVINRAWLDFFGFEEAQIVRSESQRPEAILEGQGLTPDDISHVIVTPLQAYATSNIHHFRRAQVCISRKAKRAKEEDIDALHLSLTAIDGDSRFTRFPNGNHPRQARPACE